MAREINIIKVEAEKPAEIFQAIQIKFAFVKKISKYRYKELHLPIVCRDFLGDCIWSKQTKQIARIYGFKYSYAKRPFDGDRLRLALTFPSIAIKEVFLNNYIHLLNKETIAGTEYTLWYPTSDPNTIIIEADKQWQSAAWKLSLYTFYLKLFSYKDPNKLQTPENQYIQHLTAINEKILWANVKKETHSIHPTIYEAHNQSGFVSLLTGNFPKLWNEILKDNK